MARGRYHQGIDLEALRTALQSSCDGWLRELSSERMRMLFEDVCAEFALRGLDLPADIIGPRLDALAVRVGSRFL